jgi:hypothetical protein
MELFMTSAPSLKSFVYRTTGNATLEYALPLAIVGAVALIGVGAMTPLFSGFIGKTLGQNTPQASNISNRSIQIPPMGTNPMVGSAIFTLSDGTKIQLSQWPKDLKQSVESVGANGTTELLANTMKELAQKLKDAGKIDATQYQTLVDLANRGHDLGRLQGQLEDLLKEPNFSVDGFIQKKVNYKGQSLSTERFSAIQGGNRVDRASSLLDDTNFRILTLEEKALSYQYFGGIAAEDASSDITFGVGNERYAFLTQFLKAKDQLADKDPSIFQLVQSLSNGIVALSQFSASATNELIAPGQISGVGVSINSPESFNAYIADSMGKIHFNSASICTLGNGKDTKQECR